MAKLFKIKIFQDLKSGELRLDIYDNALSKEHPIAHQIISAQTYHHVSFAGGKKEINGTVTVEDDGEDTIMTIHGEVDLTMYPDEENND